MKLTNLVNKILYEAFVKGKAIVYHNFQGVDIDENIAGSIKALNVADCIGNEPHKDYKYFTTEKKKYVEDMIRDASGDGWKKFDPIVALPHPVLSGKYAVIDGNHRLGAFTIGKLSQINVKVISEDKVLLAEQGVKWDANKVPKTIPLTDAKKQGINLKEYFSTEPLKVPSNENFKDSKAGLIQQFRQEVGPKQCSIYNKRDNCGPAALDFISWAKSKGIKNLKRIDGYFKADIPVSSKKDFTREMKQEFLNDGGDWNNAKERLEWISNSKYAEQWKYIPHYWVEDSNGKIYDPTGQQQFIDAGYAKDLNSNRYVSTDIIENYADGKVKGKSRPGRVKKAGASCKGSVTSLRAKAKKYGGEKGKMYHWCANMKSGKKNENIKK